MSNRDRELIEELDRYWMELGRTLMRRREPGDRGQHEHELSPVQHLALAQLREPLTIGALADRLGLAESSATRLVDRLETLGLVSRTRRPEDRRSVAVELTLAGRRAADAKARSRRASLAEILDALEPRERTQLVRLFAKVVAVQADRERADHNAPSPKRSTA
jgi:DNA-binding MarR family transcriptional regulator